MKTRSRDYLLKVLLLMLAPSLAHAADSEFQQWMNQQQQGIEQEKKEFQEYKDKRDKEFTEFLKMHWREMDLLKGVVRDEKPKPVVIPVAKQPLPRPIPRPKPVITPVTKQPPVARLPPVKPIPAPPLVKPLPLPVIDKGRKLKINFYGNALDFVYDPELQPTLRGRIDKNSISQFWSALSRADYESLLEQVNRQRIPLALNDWSYALLVNDIAEQVYPVKRAEQTLFTWFVLIKAGYQARVAYDNNGIYLLLPSAQPLYDVTYFTFDRVNYYALNFDGSKQPVGQVFTYDGTYPDANQEFNMNLNTALNTSQRLHKRILVFNYGGQKYRINAGYDVQTVEFLETYPQMDIDMYFRSAVSSTAANPLLEQLRPIIEGKSELEAVNILLRFVQTSFRYKTDDAQFGRENYLFPDETIHYPYSDCEDRSVLFAWLVRNLTGLDVVGLDFPGHIAAAVAFNENVKGDAVSHMGKRYVVTDPTYINASAGMTMPNYKSAKPGIIVIN